MSTVGKVNLEPVSTILQVNRKDLPLADKTLADPTNSVALVDGEWMTLNSSYKWARAADVATGDETATQLSFPLWMEKGRYDMQASGKATCLFMGPYECDTRIYNATAALNNGLAITKVLQPLKVATITIGTRNYVGLVGHGDLAGSDTDPVVGYVTRLPANNGGKLRFMAGQSRIFLS